MLESLKKLYHEIRPNALWDLTKWALGGLTLLAGAAAIFLRQFPYEVWIVIGFGFLWTVLLVVFAFRSTSPPAPAEIVATPQVTEPEYEVECVGMFQVPIKYGSGSFITQGIGEPDFMAITARLLSKPHSNAKNLSVKTIMTFEVPEFGTRFVYDGVWLDDRSAYQNLEAGGYVELILGLRKGGEFLICEREHMHYEMPSFRPLNGQFGVLNVELIGKRSGGIVYKTVFEFRVNNYPEFSIHRLGKKIGEENNEQT